MQNTCSVRRAAYLPEHMFPSANNSRVTEADRPAAHGWEAMDRAAADGSTRAGTPAAARPEGRPATPEEPRKPRRQPGAREAFPSWRAAAGRALGLARAFVLLEDPALEAASPSAHEPAVAPAHPHRQPLRPVLRSRRPGAAAPREQHCLTPVQRPTAPRIPGWTRG
jgi:hypothetical protein